MSDNKDIEEICSSCGKETTYSECHYCKKCDKPLCPECECNCNCDEESGFIDPDE